MCSYLYVCSSAAEVGKLYPAADFSENVFLFGNRMDVQFH